MEEDFKSACERSGQSDSDMVEFESFIEAYGTANWVKLHEIYIRGEMQVDDEIVFSYKFFRSDLTAALVLRDALKNQGLECVL